MRIGELAQAAGVTTSCIRFYESRGLLAPATRTANSYRSYEERDLKIVLFIEQAKSLGFSLKEIGAFLISPLDQRSPLALVPRLERKLAEIDRHIFEARDRRRGIAELIAQLQEQSVS